MTTNTISTQTTSAGGYFQSAVDILNSSNLKIGSLGATIGTGIGYVWGPSAIDVCIRSACQKVLGGLAGKTIAALLAPPIVAAYSAHIVCLSGGIGSLSILAIYRLVSYLRSKPKEISENAKTSSLEKEEIVKSLIARLSLSLNDPNLLNVLEDMAKKERPDLKDDDFAIEDSESLQSATKMHPLQRAEKKEDFVIIEDYPLKSESQNEAPSSE